MLEDAGFAWRVTGDVGGYAANSVVSQTPVPGTRVFDTGLPIVTLSLERSSSYSEAGTPENLSPYGGTRIEAVGVSSPKARTARPPAFAVRGAPKESLAEPALPVRAAQLAAWVDTHRTRTRENVLHWRYEHRWILTGATFGWWRGAEALETLAAIDRRLERIWGMSKRPRARVERALAEVRQRSR